MPATAGRVRMPANNRVHSSAALQTHGIWQSAIGYDPYAPNKEESKGSAQPKLPSNEPDAENPYNSYQGLLALARITNTNADEARGSCKKCGRVGHLTFQCRNFLSIKDENKEKDSEAIQAAVLSELDKLKGKVGKVNGKAKVEGEDSEEEEDESDSSDSDADSEIERLIAQRYGKKVGSKGKSSRKRKMDDAGEGNSDSDDPGKRKKRGRSKKRKSGKRGSGDSEDEDEGRRKRRRDKRRKRDESSDEEEEHQRHGRKSRKEKRRRRSHRHADDSDSDVSEDSGRRYARKSRRSKSLSDVDSSASDDSRVGRSRKRSKKKSRKQRHGDEE